MQVITQTKQKTMSVCQPSVGVGIRIQFRICATQCAFHFFELRVHSPTLTLWSGWCVGWGHAWNCACVSEVGVGPGWVWAFGALGSE